MPSDETIGSGGDRSDINTWYASLPATFSGVHRGRCLNQNFPEWINFSGNTATETDYMELTADAGASFVDDDSLPLRINESNFARIVTSGPGYTPLISISIPYTRVNKLQVKNNRRNRFALNMYATGSIATQLIANSGVDALLAYHVYNCLVVVEGAGTSLSIFNSIGAERREFNTYVRPIETGISGSAFKASYSRNGYIVSNASFGVNKFWDTSGVPEAGSANNATNASDQGVPTDLVDVLYSQATPFVKSTNDGTQDWKLAAGSPLEGAGAPSLVGITTDIYGNPRDPVNPSIGCFEPQGVVPPAESENAIMFGTEF